MTQITNCPVCKETAFNDFLKCKDYTVSSELFQIQECINCSFRFTNPIPNTDKLGNYYESEDYISHSNTSKDLISKIYQIARSYALKSKYNIVTNRVKGKNLLDIGSGTGDFMKHCSDNNLVVSGIEPSDKAREYGIKNYGLQIFKESQLKEWEDKKFDIISMWHVLEHVVPLNERIVEIKRLLKDSGKVFIAVPNCNSYDAKHYGKNWAAYDVPRHLYHFRKDDMAKLWAKHDCRIEEVLPMKLDSYYVSLLSEKYKGSKLLSYPKGFLTGLRSNLKAKRSGEWSSLIYVISKA